QGDVVLALLGQGRELGIDHVLYDGGAPRTVRAGLVMTRLIGAGGVARVRTGTRVCIGTRVRTALRGPRLVLTVARNGIGGEDHAHLAVAGHRAPAVQVLADHAHVEILRFTGGEPVGGDTAQGEVVNVPFIGIGQLDDEPVPFGHADVLGEEPHIASFDLHGGGVPGRLHRCL